MTIAVRPGIRISAALLAALLLVVLGEPSSSRAAANDDCINPDAPVGVEQARLTMTRGDNPVPVPDQILQRSGFDGFEAAFIRGLCTADSFEEAEEHAKTLGARLWRAAIDRAQGRRVVGDLPASDDRGLYWARLKMTRALQQYEPDFALSDEQRAALVWAVEVHSRGQGPEISFPSDDNVKRMLISGFDPFTLDPEPRRGNPSGASIMALDGTEVDTDPEGFTRIRAELDALVAAGGITAGLEGKIRNAFDTAELWFSLPKKRAIASSHLNRAIQLLRWQADVVDSGKPAQGDADGLRALADSVERLATSRVHIEAVIFPVNWTEFDQGMVEEAFGPWMRPGPEQVDATMTISQGGNRFDLEQYNGRYRTGTSNDGINPCTPPHFTRPECQITPPTEWVPFEPPQWTVSTQPIEAILNADTDGPYAINHRTSVTEFITCGETPTRSMPNGPTTFEHCARSGGGGSYLSNESAYRVTLLRDALGADIPAGHLHIPPMPFASGQTTEITDPVFEANRQNVVNQTGDLVRAAAAAID